MGRRKIEIQPITHERNRSVTFLKRKNGLFKKAYELGVLCSVDVAVIIFEERPGPKIKLHQYSSGDVQGIVRRHIRFDGEKDARGPGDFSGIASKLGDIGEGDDDDGDDGDDPRAGVFGGKKESDGNVKSESASGRAMPPPSSTSGDISMDLEYHLRRSALAAAATMATTPITTHSSLPIPISGERLTSSAPYDTPMLKHLSNKKMRLSPETLLRRSSNNTGQVSSYYHPNYRHHHHLTTPGLTPMSTPVPPYATRPLHIVSIQDLESSYQLLGQQLHQLQQQQQRQEEQLTQEISPELLSALLTDRMQTQGGSGSGLSFQGLDWPVHGLQQERDYGEDHSLESQHANWINFLSSSGTGPPPMSPPPPAESRLSQSTSWERDDMEVGDGRNSKKRPREVSDDVTDERLGGGGGDEGEGENS